MNDKLKTWINDYEDLINSEDPSKLIVKMKDANILELLHLQDAIT